jgi:hypothetical protein
VTYYPQGFRLGASVNTRKVVREQKEDAAAAVNKSLLSIEYTSTSVRSSVTSMSSNPCFNREPGDFRLSSGKGRRVQEAQKKEEAYHAQS